MRQPGAGAHPGLAALALLAAGGCAADGGGIAACPPGTGPATVAEAFFGRNQGGRLLVTQAEWDRFLAEEATPRFPDGLTATDAAGQWRDAAGRITLEPAKLLLLVLPGADAAAAQARLAPLVAAYRRRFGQDSVLTALRPACVAS